MRGVLLFLSTVPLIIQCFTSQFHQTTQAWRLSPMKNDVPLYPLFPLYFRENMAWNRKYDRKYNHFNFFSNVKKESVFHRPSIIYKHI